MLPAAQLGAALAAVRLIKVAGPWSRAVGFRHLLQPPPGQTGPPQPLWGGAAKVAGARFTPAGGFDSIYLSRSPVTAFLEVSALILLPGGPVPVRSAPWVVITVEGRLSHVLDLTDAATLSALGTNEAEITGPWARLAHPPTQRLARAAHDSGHIAGIQYPSAKHPGGTNLVVFPDPLIANGCGHLEVHDPHGNLAQRLGN